jgi:hypothetical protein
MNRGGLDKNSLGMENLDLNGNKNPKKKISLNLNSIKSPTRQKKSKKNSRTFKFSDHYK